MKGVVFMDIFSMKKSDFKDVPEISWNNNRNIKFDSLIIIPNNKIHDSGYRCMSYCAVKNGEPLCIFGGSSDVIHLDGIGGYGKWEHNIPTKFDRKPWNMDCLPCGYLHLWCNGYRLIASGCLSDFEVYTEKK